MRAWWLLAWCGGLTIGSAAGGCGGTAIVDGPEGGGGSGASTTTSTGTGAGTTTATTTGTGGSGGSVASSCTQYCAIVQQCEQYPGCVQECIEQASPECAGLYLELLTCAIAYTGPPACEFPDACLYQLDEWSSCEGGQPPPPPPPCGPVGCSISSDGSCQCDVTCGPTTYTSRCSAGGANNCACLIDGSPVGACSDSGPNMCDPWAGCCATYLFGLD